MQMREWEGGQWIVPRQTQVRGNVAMNPNVHREREREKLEN
jgi:hypothetical protein